MSTGGKDPDAGARGPLDEGDGVPEEPDGVGLPGFKTVSRKHLDQLVLEPLRGGQGTEGSLENTTMQP